VNQINVNTSVGEQFDIRETVSIDWWDESITRRQQQQQLTLAWWR